MLLDRIKRFFSAEPELSLKERPARNEACHCGSGVKYKNCCLPKERRK